MWSDEARAAALEARRRGGKGKAHNTTHEGKKNKGTSKHIKDQHKRSVAGGAIKGAGAGAIIGGAIGAAALNQFGGARLGAKLGAVAGAKTGAVAGAIYRYATNRGKKKK